MPPPSRVVYPVKPKARRPFPKRMAFVFLALAALAALGGGLWYVANLPYFRVDRVEISGTSVLPAAEIERAILDSISGTVGSIFPRDNFFFISGEALEHTLKRQFPAIRAVNVDKHFSHRLAVAVEERTLWGVYCVAQGTESAGPCVYLDTSGTAYEELSQFEGWLLPVIYGGLPAAVGTQTVPQATLQFFEAARDALTPLDGILISATISSSTPTDVRLGLAEGWTLVVSTSRPVPEWLQALETILEKEIGAKRPQLEYVDLRFGNKVFFKFK